MSWFRDLRGENRGGAVVLNEGWPSRQMYRNGNGYDIVHLRLNEGFLDVSADLISDVEQELEKSILAKQAGIADPTPSQRLVSLLLYSVY